MRDYDFYYTQDGSVGLYSYSDNDVYHSKFGALTEAWEKFIIPSGIENYLNNSEQINILDVCYGVGYNTKSVMSYIINRNENYLKEKNKNKLLKILKKILIKNKEIPNNIETIDSHNIQVEKGEELLVSIEATDNNKYKFSNKRKKYKLLDDSLKQKIYTTKINIDCLDINTELMKLSPLLKTVITPQEIFCRIVPKIFDCFEIYWKIIKFLTKISLKFAPKNNKNITELLNLKFNNYENIEKQYRIHRFVNYILVNNLIKKFGNKYIDSNIKSIIKNKNKKRFFESFVINYAYYKQNIGYKLISRLNLFAYLHNIYYDHLSNRYKNISFKASESLFEVNFYNDDARKSILTINKQYDLIFLDAFTFSKAPELWSVEFIAELYKRISPTGILITYSNSALVRNSFLENNFYIGKIIDKKTGKCIGTVASKEKSKIENPLSNYELGLCSTKAGIPYHDYTLSDTKEVILERRKLEFKNSDLMTSSQYMRNRTNVKEEINE